MSYNDLKNYQDRFKGVGNKFSEEDTLLDIGIVRIGVDIETKEYSYFEIYEVLSFFMDKLIKSIDESEIKESDKGKSLSELDVQNLNDDVKANYNKMISSVYFAKKHLGYHSFKGYEKGNESCKGELLQLLDELYFKLGNQVQIDNNQYEADSNEPGEYSDANTLEMINNDDRIYPYITQLLAGKIHEENSSDSKAKFFAWNGVGKIKSLVTNFTQHIPTIHKTDSDLGPAFFDLLPLLDFPNSEILQNSLKLIFEKLSTDSFPAYNGSANTWLKQGNILGFLFLADKILSNFLFKDDYEKIHESLGEIKDGVLIDSKLNTKRTIPSTLEQVGNYIRQHDSLASDLTLGNYCYEHLSQIRDWTANVHDKLTEEDKSNLDKEFKQWLGSSAKQ